MPRVIHNKLINKARAELFTKSGEAFNAPARVQRLADLIVKLANCVEQLEQSNG